MRLGVILMAHARERTLPAVLRQVAGLRDVADTRVVAQLDRPTEYVRRTVGEALVAGDVLIDVAPIVGGGEHFPARQNEALALLAPWRPDWIFWQADDFWFDPRDPWKETFNRALANEGIDVFFLTSLFFWNETHVRVDGFYPHVSDPLLWRWNERARYDPARQLLAPPAVVEEAQRFGRTAKFPLPLLDHGFATVEDRMRCALRSFRAGKIDTYTAGLLDSAPSLRAYEEMREEDRASEK